MRWLLFAFALCINGLVSAQAYQQAVQQLLDQCSVTVEISDFPYPNTLFLKQHTPIWHKGILLKVKPYRAYMYFFEFSDSVATERALDYFLSNTFYHGKPAQRCEDVGGIKSPPALYLVGNTSITILNQMCEERETKRQNIQRLLPTAFEVLPLQYKITIGCGGPLVWFCRQ